MKKNFITIIGLLIDLLSFVRSQSFMIAISMAVVVVSLFVLPFQIQAKTILYPLTFSINDMCTDLHWVHNRYVDKDILVSCGHCKSCLQEKANKRATRIKNEYSPDRLMLFVTLTYDRFSCPYVLHNDIQDKLPTLTIYRDQSVRISPKTHHYIRRYKRTVIGYEDCIDYNYKTDYLPYLNKSTGGKIGICLFKDVQDFNKRLRQNLKRKFNYDGKYKVYNTFEYGESTFRPHIHLLISIEQGLYKTFKSAIIASWPYADRNRTFDNIKIAKDAASYVASYVNCGSEFPLFIAKNFPPKHSFSQGLGIGNDSFQLSSLLSNVDRQHMSYNLKTSKDGVPCVVNLPIPKYVINRFFPLFKGYSRLTPSEISNVLQSASSISKVYEAIKRTDDARMRLLYHYSNPGKKCEQMIFYTLEDMFHIGTMLHNSYIRYKRLTGNSTIDYAIDFQNVWNCYKGTIIKRFMLDDEPLEYKYDNRLTDLVTPRRLAHTRELADLYDKKCKTKTVNNVVYSEIYDDV